MKIMTIPPRHFLDLSEFSGNQLYAIIDHAKKMKLIQSQSPHQDKPLSGQVLAMIFDKPSTRTRVSFDVGMRQLGGETIILDANDTQLGRGESIADTARVLSRYVDAIMIRTTNHGRLLELVQYASVPIINALTNDTHPCQVIADIMTFEEHCGSIKNKTIAWSGNDSNVLHSLIHAAAKFDFNLAIATPPSHKPDRRFIDWAKENGAKIKTYTEAAMAVVGSDCVMTDTWIAMGDEIDDEMGDATTNDNANKTANEINSIFQPYQVNSELMAKANDNAVFMHCLPAHRGEEVTDEVMDSRQSVVFDEAENRLHVQKAILAWCFGLNQ